MIRGIGIDVVEVKRIENAMRNPRFIKRILTEREASLSCPPPSRRENFSEGISPIKPTYVAGRWAAKEAIAKALNKRLGWHDVEILADDTGQPVVHLSNNRTTIGGVIKISISHEHGVAVAVAIWEEI